MPCRAWSCVYFKGRVFRCRANKAMPRLELEITEALDGRTVRSLLRGELGLSAGCVGRLKRAEGGITVGGVRVFTNAVLQTGDEYGAGHRL